MFAQLISLLQILAIVVCPLGCGKGLCHAAICQGMQGAEVVCGEYATAQCCCCKKTSSPGKHHHNQSPEKSCQGVCGGAVFEKPVELDLATHSLLLPFFDIAVESSISLTDYHGLEVEHNGLNHGGNYGRFVRTLHSSFLC